MFSPMFSILLIPFLAAMFLAVNMGGSGTAPSFSAAYGANLIRRDMIPGLFGIFVFLGAILAGKKVVLTMGKGVLPAARMGLAVTTIVMVAVGLSLLLANLLRVPQSTSQATVFALVGPASFFGILKTDKLFFEMLPTWFFLPLLSLALTYGLGRFLRPLLARSTWAVRLNGKAKGSGRVGREQASKGREAWVLQGVVILAACYVAFAIGSNNVANAAGPVASMVLNELGIAGHGEQLLLIMIMSTLVIAPCFAIGSSLFGAGLVQRTGKEIVAFGPLGATLISVVTATLLLLASVTRGIPTSLVQLNAAAIIGLGMSKAGGRAILGQRSVKSLLVVWAVAPLIAFGLALGMTALAFRLGVLV